MNKLKNQFDMIKPSVNEKARMYSNILNKKESRKRGFNMKFIKVFATFLIVLLLGTGAVYAASRIFGFDLNFLNVFNYNEEELKNKGVESEVVNYKKEFKNGLKMTINNIIFDKTELKVFMDIENLYNVLQKDENNHYDFKFKLRLNNKDIVKYYGMLSLGRLINGTQKADNIESIELDFGTSEKIHNGDELEVVILDDISKEEYSIKFKVYETITKNKSVKVNDLIMNVEGHDLKLYSAIVTPFGIIIETDMFDGMLDYDFGAEHFLYYANVIDKNNTKYLASSYPLVLRKLDNNHVEIVYSGYNSHNETIISPDDIKYLSIGSYEINMDNGSFNVK